MSTGHVCAPLAFSCSVKRSPCAARAAMTGLTSVAALKGRGDVGAGKGAFKPDIEFDSCGFWFIRRVFRTIPMYGCGRR